MALNAELKKVMALNVELKTDSLNARNVALYIELKKYGGSECQVDQWL